MFFLENYFSHILVADYRDADKFIVYCKQCNRYGNCWACPPYLFSLLLSRNNDTLIPLKYSYP